MVQFEKDWLSVVVSRHLWRQICNTLSYNVSFWRSHAFIICAIVLPMYIESGVVFRQRYSVSCGFGCISSGIGGLFGIGQALADEIQLPEKKQRLSPTDEHQSSGEYGYGVRRRRLPEGFPLLLIGFYLGGGVVTWGYLTIRYGRK